MYTILHFISFIETQVETLHDILDNVFIFLYQMFRKGVK